MINPNSIPIDAGMLSLVAELDEFKGRWEALGKMAPDVLAALKHVATIESIGSSTRVEGAKLSDAEVEALMANIDIRSFRSRDEEEVAGYAHAMNTVFESFEHIPLTENYIKQLHGILLNPSGKDAAHRGEYKKLPNNVEAFDADGQSLGVIFETATPFDTPLLMPRLISSTQSALADNSLHPLLVIASFVVHFLAIHPFQDGNGRLSRVLTTLLLLKSGYLHVPYSSLERIVEENKDSYYRALRASQRNIRTEKEDVGDWVRFFLNALKKQKDVLLGKVERERRLEKLPREAERIVILAKERGRLTISEISEALEINKNTAKVHLRKLVEQGWLIKQGTGKATRYAPGR